MCLEDTIMCIWKFTKGTMEVMILRLLLKQKRLEKRFTQKNLAEKIGIDRSYYTKIELGEKNPSFNVSLKIKEALQYKDDDIFFVSDVS